VTAAKVAETVRVAAGTTSATWTNSREVADIMRAAASTMSAT
jgi:hypothetical protein